MVVFSIKFTCATFTGRYDIARALEKWGGLHEVSRLLSLKVRHPNRQGNPSKDLKIDYITSTDAGGESKTPSKPYISLDTEKWLKKLKTFGHQLDWMRMQPFILIVFLNGIAMVIDSLVWYSGGCSQALYISLPNNSMSGRKRFELWMFP